ncbi:MAG: NAD-dependent epimerase/dehydratase family protein [Oceanococcus sp.]
MAEKFHFDKPVLVTGANGFIGLRLVRRLVDDGNQVRAFVLPGEAINAAMPDEVEIFRGDICDRESVDRSVQGIGTVLHLASLVGDGFPVEAHQKVTVGGAVHVLEAAARVQARSVLISSIVVYGDAIAIERCDESHAHGVAAGAYSRAKQAQERLAWQLVESHGLQLSVVRPGNVYGPGPTPWVRDVLDKMRKGLPILIGGGDFNAGMVYVDNVVEVIVRAAALPQAIGQTYNALDGSEVTWKRYFGDVAKMAGLKKPSSIPLWLANAVASAGEFIWWALLKRKSAPSLTKEALALVGAAHNIPIDKAREQLSYLPPVSYAQGLAQVADYIREQA